MNSNKRKKFFGHNPRFKAPRSEARNRFDLLREVDDMESSSESDEELASSKAKFLPIIVDENTSFTSVTKLMGVAFKYKRMTIGTKIISSSATQYDDAITNLKLAGLKFYTHQIQDHKKFKLVIFGLPRLEICSMAEEFKNTYNIEPVNIKEITTKRSSVDDAIYMIEFNREHVSKREVRKIRYFNGIVSVEKSYQKQQRSMYGHGSSNCYRTAVCSACAGSHDVSVCTLNKTQHAGSVVYKCFNCVKNNLGNVNHKADDPNTHPEQNICKYAKESPLPQLTTQEEEEMRQNSSLSQKNIHK